MKVTSTGSGQPGINSTEYASFPIVIADNLKEQQRIADCLTSLDENITAESHKLEALSAHKKALMQKLFPAKGEKVPALRFKEFAEAGEWDEKRLGDDDVIKMSGGGTPSTSIAEYWMGDIPWVSSSDLTDENVFDINIRKYITKSAIQNSATKLCPSNTILVVTRVELENVVLSMRKLCTSQDFTNIVSLNSNKLFLTYYLSRKMKILLKQSQGTSIKGITTDELKCLIIYLPSNDEQQRIADCLTSLDECITAPGQKIALLKEHKKGLMQQLFPRMEEENV